MKKDPRKRLEAWSLSLVALILVIGAGTLLSRLAADVSAQTIPPTAKDCLAEPRPDPLCLVVYVGMIKDLQAQVTAQDARIGRLEAQEAEQETRLASLLAQVVAQGERIETLQGRVAALDTRVAGLQSEMGARFDGVMVLVNNLLARVSALEARVGELSGS